MLSPLPHQPSPSPDQHIMVAASCWSCSAVVYRRIHPQLRHSSSLSWSCKCCDVSWSGPGEDA